MLLIDGLLRHAGVSIILHNFVATSSAELHADPPVLRRRGDAARAIGATGLADAIDRFLRDGPNARFTKLNDAAAQLKTNSGDLLGSLRSLGNAFKKAMASDEGAESPDTIARLLDAFAESRDAELRGDLKRHGDPRGAGYNVHKARRRREKEKFLAGVFERQEQYMPELRETLDKAASQLAGAAPGAASRPLEKALAEFNEQYEDIAKLGEVHRSPAMKAWIADAEALRAKFPERFFRKRERISKNPAVQASLEAIGEYVIDEDYEYTVDWRKPTGLPSGTAGCSLRMECPNRDRPDDDYLRMWEWYKTRHAGLVPRYKQAVIDHYHKIGWSAVDPSYGMDDEEILGSVTGLKITILRNEEEEQPLAIHVGISVEFDEEHGLHFQLNEDEELDPL